MAENKVDISFGVILSALQSGMGSAVASVESATGTMAASISAMSTKSTAAIAGMASSMKSEFGGMASVMGGLQGKILAVTAALAGGGIFKHAITSTMEFNESVHNLALSLGMTEHAATTMTIALKEIGISSETYSSVITKMDRQLKGHEEVFTKLGVQVRDSAGAYLAQQQIMQNALTVIESYKSGTDRNIISQFLFGRSVEETRKLLRLTTEQMEHAKKVQQDLGLDVKDSIEPMHKYQEAIADMKLAWTAASGEITRNVLPAIMSMSKFIVEYAAPAIDTLKRTFYFLEVPLAGFAQFGVIVVGTLQAIWDVAVATGKVLTDVFTGRWGNISDDAKIGLSTLTGNVKANLNQMVALGRNAMADLDKALTAAPGKINKAVGGVPHQGTKGLSGDMLNDLLGKKDPSKMSEWEAELDALRAKESLAQGKFIDFSVQQEIDFWQKKLTETKKGSEDRIAVSKRVATLEYDNYKQMFAAEIMDLKASNVQYKQGAEGRIQIAKDVASKIKSAGFRVDSKEMIAANKEIMAAEKERTDFLFNLEIEKLKATESAYKESYAMRLGIAKQIVEQIAANGETETTKYEEAKKHVEEIEREHQDTLYKIGLDRIKNEEAAERAGSVNRISLAKDYAEKVKTEKGTESTDYIQALGHLEAVTREHNDKMFELEIARDRLEENAMKQTAEIRLSIAKDIAEKVKSKYGEGSSEYIAEQEKVLQRDKELHNEVFNVKIEQIKQEVESYKKGSAEIIEALRRKADAMKEEKGANSPQYVAALGEITRAEKENKDHLFNLELEREKLEESAYSNSTARRVELARERAVKIGAYEGTESTKFIEAMSNLQQREKEHDDEVKSIEAAKLEREKVNADFMIETERERLDTLLALERITADEKDRLLQAYADKQYTREIESMNKRLELLRNEPIKYEELYNKIEAMKEKHSLTMQKLGDQEQASLFKQSKDMVAPMTTAFGSMIKGILQGTATLRSSLKGLFDSILNSFIDTVMKMVDKWAAGEMMKLGITKAINSILVALGLAEEESQVAAKATGAAETKAIQAVSGPAQVTSNAAVGASAAGASVAAIPGIGWAMVPGVMASTFGLLMSMAPIAAMAGGADIPKDMVAQVHAREMMLPAHLADRIRNMTDSGNKGNYIFNIKAMDSKDVARAMKDSKSTLNKTFRQMTRDGHLSLSHS